MVRTFFGALILGLAAGSLRADTTINAVNKYAYGANIGWVNAEGDVTHGAVIGEFFSSGYLYAANVGWIHLGDGSPDSLPAYSNASATDYGVNTDGDGRLRGLAYGANIGWVSFEALGNPRVDLLTGDLSGFAYGANVGWISLSNLHARVQTDVLDPGPNTDGDGLADAYERSITNSLATLGNGDFDGDGTSDEDECLAGTDPLDVGSFLAITAQVPDPTMSEHDVTWDSVLTRLYRIEQNADVVNASGWVDSGLGAFAPDAGAATTRTVPSGAPDAVQVFRVKAIKPLAP